MAITDVRPDEQVLYRVEQACAILAMSRSSIYREIQRGQLRSVAIGGKRRISRQAILEYADAQERSA
ncbi:MAG TPA: helix-turn-helix domain-containing protein [Ktedonobacterales bacterium]|nr:helix-turn-helix domain-containing protein [Ktedonobacterales bacterium]